MLVYRIEVVFCDDRLLEVNFNLVIFFFGICFVIVVVVSILIYLLGYIIKIELFKNGIFLGLLLE